MLLIYFSRFVFCLYLCAYPFQAHFIYYHVSLSVSRIFFGKFSPPSLPDLTFCFSSGGAFFLPFFNHALIYSNNPARLCQDLFLLFLNLFSALSKPLSLTSHLSTTTILTASSSCVNTFFRFPKCLNRLTSYNSFNPL